MSFRLYGTISGWGRSAGAVIPALGSGRYSPGPNIVLPSWLKGSDPNFTINVFWGQPGALATVSEILTYCARFCVATNSDKLSVNDLVLHRGQPPLVSVVEQKTLCGTRGVLAQVPLCAAACFPTFDDLIAVTMRTPDRDERHGTLLASERCQEKAQCDINLGLSPHLEHYPTTHRATEGTQYGA